MLPKQNRLKKKKDFELAFKKGKSFKDGFLALRAAQNNLEISRFAFVVSKRVSKKAVVRNKIRRRLSSVAEKEIKNIKNGLDVVFIALPGIEKKEFLEIKATVYALFTKAKINFKGKAKNV
jgi:ribonuclease P protein component